MKLIKKVGEHEWFNSCITCPLFVLQRVLCFGSRGRDFCAERKQHCRKRQNVLPHRLSQGNRMARPEQVCTETSDSTDPSEITPIKSLQWTRQFTQRKHFLSFLWQFRSRFVEFPCCLETSRRMLTCWSLGGFYSVENLTQTSAVFFGADAWPRDVLVWRFKIRPREEHCSSFHCCYTVLVEGACAPPFVPIYINQPEISRGPVPSAPLKLVSHPHCYLLLTCAVSFQFNFLGRWNETRLGSFSPFFKPRVNSLLRPNPVPYNQHFNLLTYAAVKTKRIFLDST